MHNDDAVSREPPSVEKSIVFFIHAVLTHRATLQFSSPPSLPGVDGEKHCQTKPNESPSSPPSTRKVNLPRNERRIILLRRKNLARFAKKKETKGRKKGRRNIRILGCSSVKRA